MLLIKLSVISSTASIMYDLRFNYGESVLRRNKIYCQNFDMTLHIIIRAGMKERKRDKSEETGGRRGGEQVPICVGQRNPWHSNDWSCKGIGQWPHKALELIYVTLERPSRNNCNGFMTIARSLKKSNLLINGYSKPLQWLRETIAMASQNHCNGFAKPLQWK